MKKDWNTVRLKNFIYENSKLIITTNSNKRDMYGEKIGIDVRAFRFSNYVVIMIDTDCAEVIDEFPIYQRISSIDKTMEDAIDVYYEYGYEDNPITYIEYGNELDDDSEDLFKFLNLQIKDDFNKLLETIFWYKEIDTIIQKVNSVVVATNPEKLMQIKFKLKSNLKESNFFSSLSFTKELELTYKKAYYLNT